MHGKRWRVDGIPLLKYLLYYRRMHSFTICIPIFTRTIEIEGIYIYYVHIILIRNNKHY